MWYSSGVVSLKVAMVQAVEMITVFGLQCIFSGVLYQAKILKAELYTIGKETPSMRSCICREHCDMEGVHEEVRTHERSITCDSTPMDTSEKLMPNNGQAVSQLEYSRVIGCLMYAMTCTRPDIAFVVGKLSRYTSNPGTQHWQAIQQISNTEDNSSTNGWVFLLGGGAISWASKKQTSITGSTIKYEYVALASAGKEAEWLKNLLLEIPLNCTKLGRIIENLVQLWVQFIPNNETGVSLLFSKWDSGLKDIHQSDGFSVMNELHESVVYVIGNGYSLKDKNKAKTEQNRAREWKERERSKPRT
ncbi:hypothetical protein Tco_0699422 [Tanacetum coccineum]